MESDGSEYFQQRERAERAAAKRAGSSNVRGVHQELAQRYADLLRSKSADEQQA